MRRWLLDDRFNTGVWRTDRRTELLLGTVGTDSVYLASTKSSVDQQRRASVILLQLSLLSRLKEQDESWDLNQHTMDWMSYRVAHENVPNSHDRGSKTKIWYSILLGNFVLTLVRLLIIRLEAGLHPNIGNTLRPVLMFTRSGITPPKVHRFGWKLEHSEYIVWGWLWQILGAIRAAARDGGPGEIFCQVINARFYRFLVG